MKIVWVCHMRGQNIRRQCGNKEVREWKNTGMSRTTTFRSKTNRICDGGPIRLWYYNVVGTAVVQWLMCCATNRKVAGSIPDSVIGIFHWHKILPIALWLWGRLSLWQKWVPGALPGDKGGRRLRLTTLPPSCDFSWYLGTLTSEGTLWATPGL